MDLWHSNNMKVILRKFAKDYFLNTELCWLYSFFYFDSFRTAHNQDK